MTQENIDFFLLQADRVVREAFAQFSQDLYERIEVRQFENQLVEDEDGSGLMDSQLQASAFYAIFARDQLLDELNEKRQKAFISSSFAEPNGTLCFFVIHYDGTKEKLVQRFQVFLEELKEALFDFLIDEWQTGNAYFYNSSRAKIIVDRAVKEVFTEVSKQCSGYVDIALYENINLSLLDVLCSLSYQTYEKSETSGLVYFTDSPLNADFQFKFERCEEFGFFSLENKKLLRKLLELTDQKKRIGIISDTNRVYGVGTIKSGCSFYSVDFYTNHRWRLCKNGSEIVTMKDNNLLFLGGDMSFGDFSRYVDSVFPQGCSEERSRKLYSVIESLIRQQRGTILVVMKDAKQYISRYRDLAMVIEPVALNEENVRKLSSVDGAIFIDEECTCYGFSVVLDGRDTGEGNRARGSRYNSSERFYNWCRGEDDAELFVFVLSDDGNYNFFPEIFPSLR